jgi:hypothetical protein
MGLTEHTLVFVQEIAPEESDPAATGVRWEVRTSEHTDKKSALVQRIFIVPVCSAFSLDAASYHRFLDESGTLAQVCGLLEEADFHTDDAAIITRKKIQACIVAAEVDSILDSYRIEA